MRIISFLTAFLIFSNFTILHSQSLVKNSSVTGKCYAGTKVTRIYIPPPDRFFKKDETKGGGTIRVNYTGFPTQAKTAVQFAISVLQSMLPADANFTINTTWEKITTSGVLAQSTITAYVGGSGIDALNPLSFYPIALAEKIAGKSLNDDSLGDIDLSVNNSINWYFGTDGQTPTTKYDLVTVVMHEICHGLGFFDSFSSDGTLGSYGIGSIPMIYDTFVENFAANRLTDTLKFANNSKELNAQLTGSQLYFNGPLLRNYSTVKKYSVLRAKLYAPSTWDAGSSVSHLDEPSYVTLPENALMTPFIDLGEAIHNPGNYTFSILDDLGWINTRIIHTPIGDTEAHLTQLALSLDIKSDTTYNHNKVGVVYSFDGFKTIDSLFLSPSGSVNSYKTTISIPSYNSEIEYYFFAVDYFQRLYRSPSVYKDNPILKNNRYRIYIGTDTVKPVISHTPAEYYLQKIDSLNFAAIVTDNLGVDSVYLEYKIDNRASTFVRLRKGASDTYKIGFSAKSLALKGHDSIQYKIFAVDTARVPNVGVLPKSGYFVVPVEEISSTVSTYSTDFTTADPDFFNLGFTISKPSGFVKYGLNSKHPYDSPRDNNKTINYTSILRHPLKLVESGMLFSFNELVLVEPGATGSVFGSSDFYDYVIVEGSKNLGKTWFNLIDGYDSRIFPAWETAYNSSTDGENSTFVGQESMLQKHTFLYRPSANITAGDTMLVRFRLFSDPFANGWGWVIEDLKISPLIDAIPEIQKKNISVYPNPGHGLIKVNTGEENAKPVHYRIFNAAGICLKDANAAASPEILIDISHYPAGMYIILLNLNDGIRTIKYSLVK
jgi:hypothetical protein